MMFDESTAHYLILIFKLKVYKKCTKNQAKSRIYGFCADFLYTLD